MSGLQVWVSERNNKYRLAFCQSVIYGLFICRAAVTTSMHEVGRKCLCVLEEGLFILQTVQGSRRQGGLQLHLVSQISEISNI